MAKYCECCGNQIGLFDTVKTLDGRICNNCAQVSVMAKSIKTLDIRKMWAISDKRKKVFSPTKLGGIAIDEKNKLISINSVIHRFNELVSYEFEEIAPTYETKKKGGITRAVVGGVIAGPVGALVGSSTAKQKTVVKGGGRKLHIYFSSFGQTQSYSIIPVEGIVGILDRIILEKKDKKSDDVDLNKNADALLKFKQLLDDGIITQEEFVEKKKILLQGQKEYDENINEIDSVDVSILKPVSKKKKPIYKKIWFWVMIWIVGIAVIGGIVGGTSSDNNSSGDKGSQQNSSGQTDTASLGELNALREAKIYLNTMAFSYNGLIKQLEFEGYSNIEATYGANNCGANWYEQASKKAKEYLRVMPFSRNELIAQLEFEGFTYEQAVYGVEQNGY